MNEFGVKSKVFGLVETGVQNTATVYWNLPVAELVEQTLKRGEGVLADNGSLCVRTGEFTGRSPKDKFAVKDADTEDVVWWGEVNNPFSPRKFPQTEGQSGQSLGHA